MTFPKNINNTNADIKFVLNRSDDQNLDVKRSEKLDANQSFLIPAKALIKGNYTLRLMWDDQ